MKAIVVYESGTGFTQRYAEWIAKELQCEAKRLKSVSGKELQAYDIVIFGGWIMGGMVAGLDKLRAMALHTVVVYAVGALPVSDKVIDEIKEMNQIDSIPFYYFQGGINFGKLGFFKKMILKTIRKSIVKKEDKTDKELYMEQALAESFDASDRMAIEKLTEYANSLM